MKTDFYSDNPMDYVRVALATETLAYHNKNYLDKSINDNCKISEEIQSLLIAALRHNNNHNEDCDEDCGSHEECNHDWVVTKSCSNAFDTINTYSCSKCGEITTMSTGI